MLFLSSSQAVAALRDDWRWPNFSVAELACRCRGRFCDGAYWHEPSFLDRLQALRDEVQRPLILTSGHRCPQWNAWVGGAPLSQHKKIAADISLKGNDRHTLRRAATQLGFTGLGLAKSFIHLDQRRVPAIWYYPGSFDLWQT